MISGTQNEIGEYMKIGRNESCPCGSGKKYKRCCGLKVATTVAKSDGEQQQKVTLGGTISELQELASQKHEAFKQVGVFLLYADKYGDSWLLEVTESDCVQIASEGNAIEVPLEENEETIVIDWTHRFSFKKKQLVLKAYRSKETYILSNAPSQKLYAAYRKLLKRISPEFLKQVHVQD